MTAAWAALALCGFGWLTIRVAEERERFSDTNLAALIMSVDLDHDAEVGS